MVAKEFFKNLLLIHIGAQRCKSDNLGLLNIAQYQQFADTSCGSDYGPQWYILL